MTRRRDFSPHTGGLTLRRARRADRPNDRRGARLHRRAAAGGGGARRAVLMPYTRERIAAAYAALFAPRKAAERDRGRASHPDQRYSRRAGRRRHYLRTSCRCSAAEPDLELHLIAHPDQKDALAAPVARHPNA